MATRGVRGATTVTRDEERPILEATEELLTALVAANGINPEDVAGIFFTVTEDLSAAFPAKAARLMGWEQVPLMDTQEIPVPGSLPRCIRVMLLWNTSRVQEEIMHVYQREARRLRPDLAVGQGESRAEGRSR